MPTFNPYAYQVATIKHIIDHPYSGLFLDMGLGKTVCTLTAVRFLLRDALEVSRVLVIAPKRVAESTWTDEVNKWEHLRDLSVSIVMGTPAQREKALAREADIYVTNRDNVVWLVMHYPEEWPFDMVILDELSSFKSRTADRFKALRKVRPFISRVVGLTGTPAPNGIIDLWPQLYLIDMGERLGRTIGGYRKDYFTIGAHRGDVVYEYRPKPGAIDTISAKIADICLSLKSSDYITLPDRVDETMRVMLSADEVKRYHAFERECVLELSGGDTITATSAEALSTKLQQYANGAIYDMEQEWHEVHRAKIEALLELLEQAHGQPVLVFYQFKHDLERIRQACASYHPRQLDGADTLREWNAGRISLLLAHPASAAYGLNMQQGGHVAVWFGLTWNLELYQQANARLHRQGQQHPVVVYHLITAGTIDERVMTALTGKAGTQSALLAAIKDITQKYEP